MIRFAVICLVVGAPITLGYMAAAGTAWAIPLALIAVAVGLVMVMEKLA